VGPFVEQDNWQPLSGCGCKLSKGVEFALAFTGKEWGPENQRLNSIVDGITLGEKFPT
jgi:hypothetical protein